MKLDVNKKQHEALKKLRGPEGALDLTGWNVQKLKDRKAKKTLEPVLQKVLPRRQRGEEYSSYYRELRVKLLLHNPHFRRDVESLRGLFHIPEGHIVTAVFKELGAEAEHPFDKSGSARAAAAASEWMQLHRSIALKYELDYIPSIPEWLIPSASTMPDFSQAAVLDWLKKEPVIPSDYALNFQVGVPLDRCVARLVERYQLPWRCGYNLRFFILTFSDQYLKDIFPFDVVMEPVDRPIGMAFKIIVDWVDEYTTEKEWGEIYEKVIKPKQNILWENRGDLGHSKRTEIDRLSEQWVIELYNFMAEHPESGVDAALEKLSKGEKWPSDGIDRSKAYRVVKRLEALMRPMD